MNREIIGEGIAMFFAIRVAQGETPKLAFVRPDDSYVLFAPSARQPLDICSDWSRFPGSRLPTASCGTTWMQLRVRG